MGVWLWVSFGEKDTQVIEEIAKLHKLPVETVTKHYKKMLEDLKKDTEKDEA